MAQIEANLHDHKPSSPASTLADARLHTIGDLAREFDISLRALRFYEDRGLLHPTRRGNARLYSEQERVRLQIILKGKHLGFTLAEIYDLLGKNAGIEPERFDLVLKPAQIIAQIDHLERQRGEIDQAIGELRATHRRLAEGNTSAAA